LNATRASLLLIILAGLAAAALSQGQQADPYEWLQASGDPSRRASIPPGEAAGQVASPILLWGQGLPGYTGSGWGWHPVHSQPLAGDVDGDGRVEVVACDAAGNLLVLAGPTGDVLAWGAAGCAPHSPPALADVDGDGVLEAAVPMASGGLGIVELYQSGSWTVTPGPVLAEALGRGGGVLAADLDGDGGVELVLQAAGGLAMVRGGVVAWTVETGWWAPGLAPLLIGDVDGDGVQDVAAAGFYGVLAAYSGSTGTGLWNTSLWGVPGLEYTFIVSQPLAADYDGDGSLEIVASAGREVFDWDPDAGTSDRTSTGLKAAKQGITGSLVVIDATTGTIEHVITRPGGFWTWFPQPSLASYDVDGDGEWEVVAASADGYLYLSDYNSGTPSLERLQLLDQWWSWQAWTARIGDPAETGAPPSGAAVALADLDGDGVVEAVCLSTDSTDGLPRYSLRLVDVTTNTTEWTFWLDWTVAGASRYGYSSYAWPGLAVADVDGDGLLEVLATVYQGVAAVGEG